MLSQLICRVVREDLAGREVPVTAPIVLLGLVLESTDLRSGLQNLETFPDNFRPGTVTREYGYVISFSNLDPP